MFLRCKYCQATQPVSQADEVDEDLRTQGIRRAFRADHGACGERAVSLQIVAPGPVAPVLTDDQKAWMANHPSDVTLTAEGVFERNGVRVCEDCWRSIPRYLEFPFGLVAPDSDQPDKVKQRVQSVDTHSGIEVIRRVVCLPCYLAAFARMYPDAPTPDLSDALIGDGTPVAPPPPPPEIYIAEPKPQAA